jgi:hypothetical protein
MQLFLPICSTLQACLLILTCYLAVCLLLSLAEEALGYWAIYFPGTLKELF